MAKAITRMTIDDAEHYTPEERQAIIDSYPAHERLARVQGIPAMGSGRVFPVAEEEITCEPFAIPKHWFLIGGMDFGWDHPTAAVQLAIDRDTDTIYVGACYKRKEATPLEHAASLKKWGRFPWAWPADAYQRDKRSGGTLRQDYLDHGMNMLAEHATHPDGGASVEAGVMDMLTRMQTGRFKVFSHLAPWLDEFRQYHRKDGVIVKLKDDLMDATRYALMMQRFAQPAYMLADDYDPEDRFESGVNEATGY